MLSTVNLKVGTRPDALDANFKESTLARIWKSVYHYEALLSAWHRLLIQ